jgi:hypothetical protein
LVARAPVFFGDYLRDLGFGAKLFRDAVEAVTPQVVEDDDVARQLLGPRLRVRVRLQKFNGHS